MCVAALRDGVVVVQLTPLHRADVVRFYSFLLVRCIAATATAAAASISTSWRETASPESPTAAETATAATTAHAGHVGSLRRHLNVAALEDAFVEDERLRDEARFRKLDIGVPRKSHSQQTQQTEDGLGIRSLPLWLS